MATQVERAIGQIQTKTTVDIDFTQHALEDGTVVSTTERVVKDVLPFFIPHLTISLKVYLI